ncbi:hypothetical protein Tco_1121860 [Tanacetum coccineum]|uniref:Uncharacterized protein n=1 Tax=Tanacetum coccineum TaxID=301880 RepID=A0ABQ5IYX8_9ASTR
MENAKATGVPDRCRHCHGFKTKDQKALQKHEEECRKNSNSDRKVRPITEYKPTSKGASTSTSKLAGSDPKNVGAAPDEELLEWILRGGKKPVVPNPESLVAEPGERKKKKNKKKKADAPPAGEADAPPEGQDDGCESKKAVIVDEFTLEKDVDLIVDEENTVEEESDSEEEDNGEWGPVLNMLVAEVEEREREMSVREENLAAVESDVIARESIVGERESGIEFYCKRREDAVYTALEARRKELEARELDISARENSAAARENTFERDLKARIKLHKSSLKFSQIACLIPNVIKVEGSSMWGNLWCKYRPCGVICGEERYLHQRETILVNRQSDYMNQQGRMARDWLKLKQAGLDHWNKVLKKEEMVLTKERDLIEREKQLL